jgi:hypothetical protein
MVSGRNFFDGVLSEYAQLAKGGILVFHLADEPPARA